MFLVESSVARAEPSRFLAQRSNLGDKSRWNFHADWGIPAERMFGSAKSWMTTTPGIRKKYQAIKTRMTTLKNRQMRIMNGTAVDLCVGITSTEICVGCGTGICFLLNEARPCRQDHRGQNKHGNQNDERQIQQDVNERQKCAQLPI